MYKRQWKAQFLIISQKKLLILTTTGISFSKYAGHGALYRILLLKLLANQLLTDF